MKRNSKKTMRRKIVGVVSLIFYKLFILEGTSKLKSYVQAQKDANALAVENAN